MPGFMSEKKTPYTAKSSSSNLCDGLDDSDMILPGLTDDVAKHCLALVPRSDFPSMAAVSKKWRSFLKSKEFLMTRKLAGTVEEWIYICNESRWEVFDRLGSKQRQPPPMPCPVKASFEMMVLDGKLLVMGGCSVVNGVRSPSADVYQYDSILNSWSRLSSMNVARYDFASAKINNMVYVVGGHGIGGESLSSAEFYDPKTNKWSAIESLRHSRWGCFGYSFHNKLYIMGGRSSFTIGNSRSVDIYDLETRKWCEIKNGCVMVTAHAVIGKKLFCLQWNKERKLAIYNPEDNSWIMVPIPLTGSSSIEFRFGILDGNLMFFSHKKTPWYSTLMYDPEAAEWRTSKIKPSGVCLCSVTIES